MGWAFTGAGLFIQTVSALLARRSLRRIRWGGVAKGTVVSNDEIRDTTGRGGAKTFYLPVVEYTDSNGNHVRFTSDSGGGAPISRGTTVRVLYNPERPQEASIANFMTLWFFPIVIAILGLPFLLAGLSALF